MINKKYYAVCLNNDEGDLWELLFNYVIKQCNFFEYNAGHVFDLKLDTSLFPNSEINSKTEITNRELRILLSTELNENLVHFYSLSEENDDIEIIMTRLTLDKELKEFLKSYNSFLDYSFSKSSNLEMYNPIFLQNETPLLYSFHSLMKAYIFLESNEKIELELKGVIFDKNYVTSETFFEKYKKTIISNY